MGGRGVPGPTVTVEGMQLDHHPDPSKSRGQYLPLLELSVQEDSEDDRNVHYLGREYMYRGPLGRLHPHPGAPPVHAHRHLER